MLMSHRLVSAVTIVAGLLLLAAETGAAGQRGSRGKASQDKAFSDADEGSICNNKSSCSQRAESGKECSSESCNCGSGKGQCKRKGQMKGQGKGRQ